MLDQDPYWLIDANLAWTSPNGRYEVSLHGKNLADTRYKVGGYDFSTRTSPIGFGNSLDAFYGDPRTVFVTLAAKFY
jgi:iron complex outermembrane receptor protein